MRCQYAIRGHAFSDMNSQEEVKQVNPLGVMIHLKRYSNEWENPCVSHQEKKRTTIPSHAFCSFTFCLLLNLLNSTLSLLIKKKMCSQRFPSRLSTWSLERLGSKGRYPEQLNPLKSASKWFVVNINPMDSCISCSNFLVDLSITVTVGRYLVTSRRCQRPSWKRLEKSEIGK